MAGSQDYTPDPRNEHVLVYVSGNLVPRADAVVSVFDAGFALGDGIWEGIRLHNGCLLFLEAHIDRLFAGAAAISLDIGLNREQVAEALRQTVAANGMQDGVHLRLMVTRGIKATVNQDPRNALGRPTIVITAEFKAATAATKGLVLHTSNIRCSGTEMFDMRLNSHSRLNLIRALLEAIDAGADEALMLDPNGFVSSCNATNFFCVRDGVVLSSDGAYCFNGITRANVLSLCEANGLPTRLGQLTLAAAHVSDEAFVTGTLGGITPVRSIDGHNMAACPGPVTTRLQRLYAAMMGAEAAA